MERVNLSELKNNAFNLRVFNNLSDEEFNSLKQDIKERGLQNPIEITKENIIITGHQRTRACKELGFETIEVNIRNDLDTDEKIKEHLIKDNILRRQLRPKEIARAGIELEIIERKKAEARLKMGKEKFPYPEELGQTRDKVAENFGISGKTYEAYKKADEIASKDEKLKEAWESNQISAHNIIRLEKIKELEEKEGMDTSFLKHTTVWSFKDKGTFQGLSNLPKPFIQNIVYHYSKEGDLVGDPFAGSGITKNVCDEMGRKSILSDIKPTQEYILKKDIREELSPEYKNVDLIILDPPYWSMVDYGKKSMGNSNLNQFIESINKSAISIKKVLKEKGVIALIMMPMHKENRIIDLSYLCVSIFKKHFTYIERICVPVIKQPHPIKKGSFMHTLRDLLIFKNEN